MNEQTEKGIETALRRLAEPGPKLTPEDFAPKPKPGREPILAEREATHGDFSETAEFAQNIKGIFRIAPAFEKLPARQREALDLIATKLARVLVGNNMEPDHWRDLAGYAKLGEEACK